MTRVTRLLPAIAFVGTFGVFFADKNREARTVLRSGRGLATIVVLVVGYLVVAQVVRRTVRWRPATSVVMTGVVIGAAAWTVLPYYVDKTVNRTMIEGPVSAPPTSLGGTSATLPSDVPTTTVVPAAVRLSAGSLRGIDHTASGRASLIRSADGSVVVRFEAFAIEGAPDPVVYLARGEDVRTKTGIKLGRLPGNRGDVLDIPVPGDSDAGAGPGWTVLIWCERFAVPIANATQA